MNADLRKASADQIEATRRQTEAGAEFLKQWERIRGSIERIMAPDLALRLVNDVMKPMAEYAEQAAEWFDRISNALAKMTAPDWLKTLLSRAGGAAIGGALGGPGGALAGALPDIGKLLGGGTAPTAPGSTPGAGGPVFFGGGGFGRGYDEMRASTNIEDHRAALTDSTDVQRELVAAMRELNRTLFDALHGVGGGGGGGLVGGAAAGSAAPYGSAVGPGAGAGAGAGGGALGFGSFGGLAGSMGGPLGRLLGGSGRIQVPGGSGRLGAPIRIPSGSDVGGSAQAQAARRAAAMSGPAPAPAPARHRLRQAAARPPGGSVGGRPSVSIKRSAR